MKTPALLLLVALPPAARGQYEAFSYPACTGPNQYLDVSTLRCYDCPTNTAPDSLGTSCQCSGSRALSNGDTTTGSCNECPAGHAATRDGRSCLLCNSASTISTSQIVPGFVRRTCECPAGSGQVLVERDENGALLPSFECRRCPTGQQPSNGVCVDCSDALMQATAASGYVCTCPSPAFTNRLHPGGLWGRDVSCVYQPEGSTRPDSIRLDFKKEFDAILPRQGASLSESVADSIAIMQLLEPSFAACRRAIAAPEPNRQTLLAGTRACQAVGNLCVLANYDENNNACKAFEYLKASNALNSVDNNDNWVRLHACPWPSPFACMPMAIPICMHAHGHPHLHAGAATPRPPLRSGRPGIHASSSVHTVNARAAHCGRLKATLPAGGLQPERHVPRPAGTP